MSQEKIESISKQMEDAWNEMSKMLMIPSHLVINEPPSVYTVNPYHPMFNPRPKEKDKPKPTETIPVTEYRDVPGFIGSIKINQDGKIIS